MAHETQTKLEIHHAPGAVTIEPAPIHGVRGFTIVLDPARAMELAQEIRTAAVMAMPPTCGRGV